MTRIRLFSMLAGLVLAVTGTVSHAEAEGDPERGATIAYTCTGCHGIQGYKNVYPTYSVPKIGGQSKGYLVASIRAYRNEERHHPTMNAQAATLSDQDILDVAAYFVGLSESE